MVGTLVMTQVLYPGSHIRSKGSGKSYVRSCGNTRQRNEVGGMIPKAVGPLFKQAMFDLTAKDI